MREFVRLSHVWLLMIFALSGCASIESDWAQTRMEDRASSYQKFFSSHGKNKYNAEAWMRFEELEWAAALRKNNIQTYEIFLRKHSKSPHVAAATERLDKLLWEHTTEVNSVAAYGKYMFRFPAGSRVKESEECFSRLEAVAFKSPLWNEGGAPDSCYWICQNSPSCDLAFDNGPHGKIGRASCRERV